MKSFQFLSVALLLAGSSVFAQTKNMTSMPALAKIYKAASDIKQNDVRTVISKAMKNVDENPCLSDYYHIISIQSKQANLNRETMKVEYTWKTIDTKIVDTAGNKIEVCAE